MIPVLRLSRHVVRQSLVVRSGAKGAMRLPAARPRCDGPLWFGRETVEISEHGSEKGLPAWVLRGKGSSKEVEKIASLLRGLVPIRRWRRDQVGFQFLLPQAQGRFVGRDVGQQPPKLGRLLGGHAAVVIQIDCPVRHDLFASRLDEAVGI
jgi:hypothetical protein